MSGKKRYSDEELLERRRAKCRKYYAQNKAKEIARCSAYNQAHKEEIKASRQACSSTESFKQQRKQYRQTDAQRAAAAAYLAETVESRAEKQKIRDAGRRATPEGRAKDKQWKDTYRANPENQLTIAAAAKRWREANRARRLVLESKRRAMKQSAVPPWFGELDEFVMQEAAELCKLRKTATGIDWNIDHIVPLISPIVCGLHVAANIAVIPAKMNQSKGNRHWPDMP